MTRNLCGFMGGVAESGARFKIEILKTASGYAALSSSAGGSSAWAAPTTVAEGDLATVTKKAATKFAGKTVPGRDRAYTRPMGGGPVASPFPKGGTVMPDHPLCWAEGRPLDRLPAELHHRAVLAAGQQAGTPPSPAPVVAVAGALHPTMGQEVMLCETIPDAAELELMLCLDQWMMTEKMEGDRAQLHIDEDGVVYMTNRSGGLVNCPPHIALAMESMPPNTSFDGEVITVDREGAAQLYVGGRANIQLFVAFDLLAHPDMPDGMGASQIRRLGLLAQLLPAFQPPLGNGGPAIRCVGHAFTEAGKRMLLAEIRQRYGEGVVMRNAAARYEGRRSHSWQRFCDRERTVDAVVLSYKHGTGKFANTVGGVEVGLYDGATLRSIGWAGSGWTDAQRGELQAAWDDQRTGYVVVIKCYGLSFADQVIRPSGVRIRAAGDKSPRECRFESEIGRSYGAFR
ncbi:MAG: hypothetical protein WCI67_06980 [Chloroflexales bacterium]